MYRHWFGFTIGMFLCACRDEHATAQGQSSAASTRGRDMRDSSMTTPPTARPSAPNDTPELARARRRMVQEQIAERGVRDERVLSAMRAVPRHEFVAPAYRRLAYTDSPLPIEAEQTISQPYVVALMTELAQVTHGVKVLEVGTGSGYQAAVLAELGAEVHSIEIVKELADGARTRLDALRYAVKVRHGDGYAGWPDAAPFDAIVITAAPPRVPEPLRQQLAIGGRLVVPVGDKYQDLLVITRTAHGYEQTSVAPVRFVPMTGHAQQAK
jgi:protein-L-isoaspartate(D-aspartate) O-methyltransferase